MRHQPGISWGYNNHINLIRSSIGWLAIYCDYPNSIPEIIRVFKPKNIYDYYQMVKQVAFYNYNTCVLCPIVKMELDWTT